jgi:repressor of nif and glnA expression
MAHIFVPKDEIERKTLMILRALHEAAGPIGSRIIARRMQEMGAMPSERAVRYHLRLMDERGLTQLVGRKNGRVITEQGIEELRRARVRDKVGLAISRIESLSFQTTFHPETRRGLLPVNLSLFRRDTFPGVLKFMKGVFQAGLAVSDLVAVAAEGERLGDFIVPEGKVGLATVCSLVVNGVLLKHGIPMDSKFGGILQIEDREPRRFTELIYYSGSSLDPSEVFIRGKMTSVGQAVETGNGMILANFREIPAPCLPLACRLIGELREARINGVLKMGEVSEAVCQIPVDVNKIGLILMGGLNPSAMIQELGMDVENRGMSALLDYTALVPFISVYQTFTT